MVMETASWAPIALTVRALASACGLRHRFLHRHRRLPRPHHLRSILHRLCRLRPLRLLRPCGPAASIADATLAFEPTPSPHPTTSAATLASTTSPPPSPPPHHRRPRTALAASRISRRLLGRLTHPRRRATAHGGTWQHSGTGRLRSTGGGTAAGSMKRRDEHPAVRHSFTFVRRCVVWVRVAFVRRCVRFPLFGTFGCSRVIFFLSSRCGLTHTRCRVQAQVSRRPVAGGRWRTSCRASCRRSRSHTPTPFSRSSSSTRRCELKPSSSRTQRSKPLTSL